MATIEITMGDGGFGDIEVELSDFQMGERRVRVNYLPGGTSSGMPSIAFAVQRDDGTWFVWETTARAFCAAAAAIKGAAECEGIEL